MTRGRLGSLVISLTVASSGAAIAVASAGTPSSQSLVRRHEALAPHAAVRCGLTPGQQPCSWWRGVNIYSGFSDQLGPGGQLGPRAVRSIDTLARDDANSHLVYVSELDSAPGGSVSIGSRAVSDEHLIEAAGYGSRHGGVAVLKPHIANPTAVADTPRFVSSYISVLKHYGAVATRMHAKVFVITTELTQIYRDSLAMNALIEAAMSTYHVPGGQLAVALNWDQLHEALAFSWLRRVQLIGVDAYWPIGPAMASVVVAMLERSWRQPAYQTDGSYEPPARALSALGATGHQVVFTEIGYPDCQGATAAPSTQVDLSDPASCGQAARTPQEQRAAILAAYCYWTSWARAHNNPGWFHGLWWWDWDLSAAPNTWDIGSNGGAESVVRSWNTGNGASCPNVPT